MASVPSRQHRTTRPPRSPSNSRSSVSKRSPSPIISSLSSENPKGVKNITRKVIKRLEGLGHLEMIEADFSVPELDHRCQVHELETVVSANVVKPSSDKHQMNGNGITHVGKAKVSKTDFEIPRKLLHSSIGRFACPSLSPTLQIIFKLCRFRYTLSLRFRSKCRFHREIPLVSTLYHCASRFSSFSVSTIRTGLRACAWIPHARN